MDNYYVYIYLDPRKEGEYKYDDLLFRYEPFYVGKGINNRCYKGITDKNFYYKENKINSIISEGYLPIVLKYIECLSEENAYKYEILLIKKIGRNDKNLGPLTNLTDGGPGMKNLNKHIQRNMNIKISLSNKGKSRSDDTKLKISIANTGKIRSDEFKNNQRINKLGSTHSIEWIKKLSKPVLQYDLDMNFIKEYPSITIASTELNIEGIQISNVCNKKKYYKTAAGFIWQFKNECDKDKHKKTYSHNHSEETKRKLRKSKNWKTDNKKHPSFGKRLKSKYPPILQYDLDMNFIKEWPTLSELCEETNYNCSLMINVLHNTKNYAYKYYWKFKE